MRLVNVYRLSHRRSDLRFSLDQTKEGTYGTHKHSCLSKLSVNMPLNNSLELGIYKKGNRT